MGTLSRFINTFHWFLVGAYIIKGGTATPTSDSISCIPFAVNVVKISSKSSEMFSVEVILWHKYIQLNFIMTSSLKLSLGLIDLIHPREDGNPNLRPGTYAHKIFIHSYRWVITRVTDRLLKNRFHHLVLAFHECVRFDRFYRSSFFGAFSFRPLPETQSLTSLKRETVTSLVSTLAEKLE